MAKTKLTAFSRILLFLLIFTPITFLASSYLTGQNAIELIKEKIGLSTNETAPNVATNSEDVKDLNNQNNKELTLEIRELKVKVKELEQELKQCQDTK